MIINFFWQMDYNKRGCVYRFVRKPFVLPFQPKEQIPDTFDALSTIAYKLYREDLDQPNHQRGLYTAWLWGQTTTSRNGTTASTVLLTILRSSDSTTQGDHQHPHPAKDDQRRKIPEIPTKDYKTTTVPHLPTLGPLERWNYIPAWTNF